MTAGFYTILECVIEAWNGRNITEVENKEFHLMSIAACVSCKEFW